MRGIQATAIPNYRLSAVEERLLIYRWINDNLADLISTMFEEKICHLNDFSITNLSEIAEYKNGLAMQKYRPIHDELGLPVLKIRELNQGFIDNNSDRCASNIDSKVIVKTGDIIFSW